MKALLLVNRSPKKEKILSQAVSELQNSGIEIIEEPANHPQQLPNLIRRYQHQVDVIIGGGSLLDCVRRGKQQDSP